MFLLVSVRHVGAHPGEHQHGVSIQISISLGKTFLRISRIRDIPLTWILARVFVYVPPIIPQILDFIYWTVLILIHFEWSDTENQQYLPLKRDSNVEKLTHFFSTWQTSWCVITTLLQHTSYCKPHTVEKAEFVRSAFTIFIFISIGTVIV